MGRSTPWLSFDCGFPGGGAQRGANHIWDHRRRGTQARCRRGEHRGVIGEAADRLCGHQYRSIGGERGPMQQSGRSTLEEAIKINPALNLPVDASEEVRRLMTFPLALLDLMAKASIAETNDALLSIRSIFAGNLLAEYRTELLSLKPSEDIRIYADITLDSITGSSNSLEACLRVAVDPAVALEELNGELDAEAEVDEYEDGDEEDDEENGSTL